MTKIAQKSYQTALTDERLGMVTFDNARRVQSFGIVSFIAVIPLSSFSRLFESQLEVPKKKTELPEDAEDLDFADMPLADAVPILLALLQRGWNKGRKDNVARIEEYGRRGLDSAEPCDIVHLPEFTVYSHGPVHFEPSALDKNIGRVTGDLLNVLVDGLTRGTGLKKLLRSVQGACGDEDLVLRIVPGIPLHAAKQIFVDMNTTAIPVPFADVVEKDARRPAFRLATNIASMIPGIKPRQAYMFVQQALMGPAGETANAEPVIDDYEGKLRELTSVVKAFECAMGPARWGNEQHVLSAGYGLAAVGRLYFDGATAFERTMSERVARMSWDRDDARVQKAGFAEPGKTKTKTKLTSYPVIRKFSEFVRGASWRDLELSAEQLSALKQTSNPAVAAE
jgi:hypothetical protein